MFVGQNQMMKKQNNKHHTMSFISGFIVLKKRYQDNAAVSW